jgi:hypothetical protein
MKLTSQTPSSTSLIPRRWPARTVEALIRLRCMQMRPQSGDEEVAVVQGIGEFRQAVIGTWGGSVDFGGAFHVERPAFPR